MNFVLVENCERDYSDIYSDFVQDYIFSDEINTRDLREKYGLSHKGFKEICHKAKDEYGVSRRPYRGHFIVAKNYYKNGKRFSVRRIFGGKMVIFGNVPSEDVAKKCVMKCKEADWDKEKCYEIVRNWRNL